jgi:cyclase
VVDGVDEVFIQAGKKRAGLRTREWAREVVSRGAGEILLTSMDHDGVRSGFALDLIRGVEESISVPIIASGGAGDCRHFLEVFTIARADAALAAGIFHEGLVSVPAVKEFLASNGVEVRR